MMLILFAATGFSLDCSCIRFQGTGSGPNELFISTAFADETTEKTPTFNQQDLFLTYLGIAVATVVDIKTEKWSEKLPPLPVGRLLIEETIRGDVPATVHFVPIFYATDDYDESTADLTQWKGKPLTELIGKQWIIVVNGVNVTGVYPYSEQTVQYIKSHQSKKGFDDDILMVLFCIIIVIAFVPLKWASKLGNSAPLLLLLGQLMLYGLYEWGTPAYYNIRADLIVIIPAIIFCWIRVIRFSFHNIQAEP